MKIIKYSLLISFAIITTTVHANNTLHWTKTDYLINSFIDIALNNEYSAKQSRVRKWTQPIQYWFIHHSQDKTLHEHLTRLHLDHLATITGVTIRPAKQKENANLTIIFSNEALLAKHLRDDFKIKSAKTRQQLFKSSVCLANISIHKNHALRKAIIIIPVDRARAHAKLVACIIEEITQIMGLPNDSDQVFPSIFNDKSYNDLLSGLDYMLLKMLYHPKVKVGMTASQIKPILRDIIHSFRSQGVIKNAERNVMQGALYKLLD